MEALYARGFTNPDSVMELTKPLFQSALAGTVSYSRATDICEATSALPFTAVTLSPWPGQGFQPVNGGDLVNCIPPAHLYPLGPVDYLFEMLGATLGTAVLGNAVAGRRSLLGNLSVIPANLRLQLPLLNLALESLEALGTTGVALGAVYDTEHGSIVGIDQDNNEELLLAVSQYSTPSTAISQPGIYKTLDRCFTSPQLPYSQSLDICHSYVKGLSTC